MFNFLKKIFFKKRENINNLIIGEYGLIQMLNKIR